MKNYKTTIFCLVMFIVAALPFSALALEMKAGTAKASITPADPLGRITVMGGPVKGVNHDIFARVLVLDDGIHKMVIVTYDLNCLDVATPILRSRVLHELGIAPAFLIMMATHNHAAPIQIVPKNFDYGRWLADRIFLLIQEAIKNESGPVRVYFGTKPGDFIRSDARYPQVYGLALKPIDNEVELLKVTQGDKVKALLVSQATHPALQTFSKIDPGHPGYAMEELEKDFPGALALYADGCGGDQFPSGAPALIATPDIVKRLSHKLASTVTDISKGSMVEVTGKMNSELKVISLPLLPPISYEDAKKLAARKRVKADVAFIPYPEQGREDNWIRSVLQHYEKHIAFPTHSDDYICTDDGFLVKELPTPREFPCRYEESIVASIGTMVLVAMQGEVCAPIGKRIKDANRSQKPVMVCAYMGEHNLYIPTRRLVEIKAYQSDVIQSQYASPVGWSPDIEDVMVNSVNKLVDAIIGK
jgi:neutral ceramidase